MRPERKSAHLVQLSVLLKLFLEHVLDGLHVVVGRFLNVLHSLSLHGNKRNYLQRAQR